MPFIAHDDTANKNGRPSAPRPSTSTLCCIRFTPRSHLFRSLSCIPPTPRALLLRRARAHLWQSYLLLSNTEAKRDRPLNATPGNGPVTGARERAREDCARSKVPRRPHARKGHSEWHRVRDQSAVSARACNDLPLPLRLPPLQSLARLQSHSPTRPQPRPLRPRLQIHHAAPPPRLPHRQRAPLRLLPRRPRGRLHRLRPRHPQLRLPADRHLRVCARVPRAGQAGGAAAARRQARGRRRRRRLGVSGRWPFEEGGCEEWVAHVCQCELGHGDVYFQVASRDGADEFEE